MEFGIGMAPRVDNYKLVGLAEELGFTHAWVYDIPTMYPDPYIPMALCAERTKRIKIGPGVAVPGTRTAFHTANNLATLNRLAPGRIVYAVGTGHTARRTFGLPPFRLDDLAQYVKDIRALLQGQRVTIREGQHESLGQFIYPASVHMNLQDPIPIYISAWGPRALALAAELGDGVFVRGSFKGYEQVRDSIAQGAARAGKGVEEIPQLALLYFYILGPGEDPTSEGVRRYIAPLLFANIDYLAWALKDFSTISPPMARALRNYWQVLERYPEQERHIVGFAGHTTEVMDEFMEKVITPELLSTAKSIFTADQAREFVSRMAEVGVTHIAYQVAGDEEAAARRFAEEIIQRV